MCIFKLTYHTFTPIFGPNTSDRSHAFCCDSSLRDEANIKSLTYQADIRLPLPGCSDSDSIKQRCVVAGKSKTWPPYANCDLLHTVFSPSLPSCVVSLFLPWGGDGRSLQGKSNNFSHHLYILENVDVETIQAIFPVVARENSSWTGSLKCSHALPPTGSAWTLGGSPGCRLMLFLLIHVFTAL